MDKAIPPPILSLEFHLRFFPALLRGRLRPRERAGTGFSSIMEFQITFAVCAILVVMGIPKAVSQHSVIGWVMGGIGAAGILALLIHSISSHRDPPSFDFFLIGVFSFFVVTGISTGVFFGALRHSLPLGLLIGSGGLIAGYLLGILAGLWFQRLGWLASLANGLGGLAVVGMLIVDLALLSGSLFG